MASRQCSAALKSGCNYEVCTSVQMWNTSVYGMTNQICCQLKAGRQGLGVTLLPTLCDLVIMTSTSNKTTAGQCISSLTCRRSARRPSLIASMLLNALSKPARPSASIVSHIHTSLISIAVCWGLLSKISVRRTPTRATLGYALLQL